MELDKSFIESVIRKIIEEEAAGGEPERRVQDPSGVIAIDPKGMELEKFPFPIESEQVWLKDVLTLEESPRLGCGIMELDHTSFAWTLTYDEVDYVIEGTLEIVIDGRRVTAGPGEIVFIPKDTKIRFSTPDRTRFMYVCYPANWAEQ